MLTYPVCLVGLERKRVIVVGGGQVAVRKTQSLLEAGAAITAISPQFCVEFQDLASNNQNIEMIQRTYQNGDLAGAFLVIAATDTADVNQAVWEEASKEGCLINVVDDPVHCNFILPAVVQRGSIKISISTGGSSPALARRLRERLDDIIDPEYGDLADILDELRPDLQQRFEPGEQRLQAAMRLIDSDLLSVIRLEGKQAARQRAFELLRLQLEDER